MIARESDPYLRRLGFNEQEDRLLCSRDGKRTDEGKEAGEEGNVLSRLLRTEIATVSRQDPAAFSLYRLFHEGWPGRRIAGKRMAGKKMRLDEHRR
jgi:hypothetical protein